MEVSVRPITVTEELRGRERRLGSNFGVLGAVWLYQ
jgi:hypothetical protein